MLVKKKKRGRERWFGAVERIWDLESVNPCSNPKVMQLLLRDTFKHCSFSLFPQGQDTTKDVNWVPEIGAFPITISYVAIQALWKGCREASALFCPNLGTKPVYTGLAFT